VALFAGGGDLLIGLFGPLALDPRFHRLGALPETFRAERVQRARVGAEVGRPGSPGDALPFLMRLPPAARAVLLKKTPGRALGAASEPGHLGPARTHAWKACVPRHRNVVGADPSAGEL